MKDTHMPLSIAFLHDSGLILSIHHMVPMQTDERYRSLLSVRYALEVNQGWFAGHGIGAGDIAEMKLPGEAWLEFKIRDSSLEQTATFRPKGLFGRIYWYTVLPFHGFIFEGCRFLFEHLDPIEIDRARIRILKGRNRAHERLFPSAVGTE